MLSVIVLYVFYIIFKKFRVGDRLDPSYGPKNGYLSIVTIIHLQPGIIKLEFHSRYYVPHGVNRVKKC